jgi:membrane protease YdiL (CAAX protease family)
MEPDAPAVVPAPTQSKFNWPEFWILTGAGIFGFVMLLPYLLRLVPAHTKYPLWVAILIELVQIAIIVAGAVALGVGLGKRCGLRAPILEVWLAGQRVGKRVVGLLWPAVPLGVIAGLILLAADKYFFLPRTPQLAQLAQTGAEPARWQGFLASFYGGITEELLLRFGMLTLFAWVLGKLSNTAEGRTTPAVFWTANLLTAILFGLGHLPVTAALVPFDQNGRIEGSCPERHRRNCQWLSLLETRAGISYGRPLLCRLDRSCAGG